MARPESELGQLWTGLVLCGFVSLPVEGGAARVGSCSSGRWPQCVAEACLGPS